VTGQLGNVRQLLKSDVQKAKALLKHHVGSIRVRTQHPIPEAIDQLQLEHFRSTQPQRSRLTESLWQAAVDWLDSTAYIPPPIRYAWTVLG
jgi:hypothetical protein